MAQASEAWLDNGRTLQQIVGHLLCKIVCVVVDSPAGGLVQVSGIMSGIEFVTCNSIAMIGDTLFNVSAIPFAVQEFSGVGRLKAIW